MGCVLSLLPCIINLIPLGIETILRIEDRLNKNDPDIYKDIMALVAEIKKYKKKDRARIINFVKRYLDQNISTATSLNSNDFLTATKRELKEYSDIIKQIETIENDIKNMGINIELNGMPNNSFE